MRPQHPACARLGGWEEASTGRAGRLPERGTPKLLPLQPGRVAHPGWKRGWRRLAAAPGWELSGRPLQQPGALWALPPGSWSPLCPPVTTMAIFTVLQLRKVQLLGGRFYIQFIITNYYYIIKEVLVAGGKFHILLLLLL